MSINEYDLLISWQSVNLVNKLIGVEEIMESRLIKISSPCSVQLIMRFYLIRQETNIN